MSEKNIGSSIELKNSLLSLKQKMEEYESMKEETFDFLGEKIKQRFRELLNSDVYVEFSVLGYTNKYYRYFLESENFLVFVHSLNFNEIEKGNWTHSPFLEIAMDFDSDVNKPKPQKDFSISIEQFVEVCNRISEEFNVEVVIKNLGKHKSFQIN